VQGRVWHQEKQVPRVYVTGWIKRGSTGVIGTNRGDSVETISALTEDRTSFEALEREGTQKLRQLLSARGIRFTNYNDWVQLDQLEISRGKPRGKPREKITRVFEMLTSLQ
jgi:ferredoxin/flavodoxin---NADP+ reductase